MMDGTAIADEFAGCTLEDVALAVGYGEPGSEDHALALDALRRRLPGSETAPPPRIGHNQPPLAELLDEELLPYKRRRDELVRVAETAAITDDDSAANVLDLAQMCRAFETEIDARRKQLVQPHREAEKTINDRHNRLRLDVQVALQDVRIDFLAGDLGARVDADVAAVELVRRLAWLRVVQENPCADERPEPCDP